MKRKQLQTEIKTNEIETLAEKEFNPDIAKAIKSELPSDTAALSLIAPYIPARISPKARILASIGLSEELGIEEAITEIKKYENIDKLYLLLNSFGGGVTSTYKVARMIRDSFIDVTVFIPHLAASGGTVIALVGNKIVMGDMSNLTPIDVQTTRKGKPYSVNSMIRSFGNLNEYFEKISEEHAPYPWKAMANKLDPVEFQEWVDASNLSQLYAKRILEHKYSSLQDKADEIISRLSTGYPIHECAIMKEEAKEIFGEDIVFNHDHKKYLNIWNSIRDWLRLYVTRESVIHFIRYILPNEK